MKLVVLFSLLLGAASAAALPSAGAAAIAAPSPAPLSPDALLSRRALRRARLLIQMRMLEFRAQRLECVREALLRQLPPGLRPVEPTTWAAPAPPKDACLRKL